MTKKTSFELATELVAAGDIAGLQELFKKGTNNQKLLILQSLKMGPSSHLVIGPEIVQLAVKGLRNKERGTRIWACDLIADQHAKGVDVSAAVEPLLPLLRDHAHTHRPALAAGQIYNPKGDMSPHFQALRELLGHPNDDVAAAAAWAIGKFSLGNFDISPATADLAPLLANPQNSANLRKQAAQALLHHAQKSPAALAAVRQAVQALKLDNSQKEVRQFLKQLAAL